MKRIIQIEIEYVWQEECVLTNDNGDTFTFNPSDGNGEELDSFLQGAKKIRDVVSKEVEPIKYYECSGCGNKIDTSKWFPQWLLQEDTYRIHNGKKCNGNFVEIKQPII